jgi:hypothetical protein
MRLDVGVSALLERDRLCLIETRTHARDPSCVDRVDTLMSEPAGLQRLRACFLQAVERERSEAHLAGAAIEHVAIYPGRAALGDLQIEPAAIGVHAGFSHCSRHLEGRQPSRRARHFSPLRFIGGSNHPQTYPQWHRGSWRMSANVSREKTSDLRHFLAIYRTIANGGE